MRLHFLPRELHNQLVAAGVGIPVNMPEVITRLIFAVILKIHRAAREAPEAFAPLPVYGGLRQGKRITQSQLLAAN